MRRRNRAYQDFEGNPTTSGFNVFRVFVFRDEFSGLDRRYSRLDWEIRAREQKNERFLTQFKSGRPD
jgi:hypothetical protein